MSEASIAQIVGAVMGAVTAIAIAGIIKLLNRNKDIDF